MMPWAGPLTADTTGLRNVSSCEYACWTVSRRPAFVSSDEATSSSMLRRGWTGLNLSPEPVSTTARTSGSRLSGVNMSRSSAKYECSTSSSSTGAKVTVATPPPTWNWRCLKAA